MRDWWEEEVCTCPPLKPCVARGRRGSVATTAVGFSRIPKTLMWSLDCRPGWKLVLKGPNENRVVFVHRCFGAPKKVQVSAIFKAFQKSLPHILRLLKGPAPTFTQSPSESALCESRLMRVSLYAICGCVRPRQRTFGTL